MNYQSKSKNIIWPKDTDTIRSLKPTEYKKAAKTFQACFQNDPFAQWLSHVDNNSPEEAKKLDLNIWECMMYAHLLNGVCHMIGNWEGISCWLPPGRDCDDWLTMLRSGIYNLRWKMGPEGRQRFYNEFMPVLHDAKSEVMGHRDKNCWYLVYLGTTPKGRGKGLSRKLMEHVTNVADKQSIPCYLESSNPINVGIYNRFGYEVVKQIVLNENGRGAPVPLDLMIREPRFGESEDTLGSGISTDDTLDGEDDEESDIPIFYHMNSREIDYKKH